MIDVCVLKPDELNLWIKLRIEALADAPGAFGDTVDQAKRRTDEEWQESLLDPDLCLLIAFDGETPIGMARVRLLEEKPGTAGLYSMWVAPAVRRKGIGKALMDAALLWAEHRHVTEMILFVTQGNHRAKQLYLRTGFVETGTLRPMRSNAEVQMEEMVRRI